MNVLKAWDYARTMFQSEKLRIAYKNRNRHIVFNICGLEMRPAGAFWADKLYFGLEMHPAGTFCADKIIFWARKASRRGLLVGSNYILSRKSVPQGAFE